MVKENKEDNLFVLLNKLRVYMIENLKLRLKHSHVKNKT